MSAAAPDDREPATDSVATLLDMTLPAECIAGVRQNMIVLADHWAALRHAIATELPSA